MAINGIEETEEKILGILINSNKYRDDIFILLEGYIFQLDNRKIYNTIQQMHKDKEHIDNVTLTIELKNNNILTSELNLKIAEISIDYIGASLWKHYCKILLKNQLNSIIQNAKTVNDLDIIQKINDKISKYDNNESIVHISHNNNEIEHYYNSIENKILSGYFDLDKITKGFLGGELIIIAAATGAGKTAFALNLVKKISSKNKNVLLISLEMSKREIRKRLNCSELGINSLRVRGHELNHQASNYFDNLNNSIDKMPVYINQNYDISIKKIKEYASYLKEDNKLDLIVIDYLTLIKTLSKFNSKREEVIYLTRELKILAQELQVPVITLAQLSRSNTDRQNKRPILSDLKESSSIEQDADIVIFLYREDYYDSNSTKKGILEVAVAKGRDCGTGTCELYFNKEYQRISNIGEYT